MKYLLMLWLASALVFLGSGARAGVVMFPQPWRESGANLREMINDPDGWKESRAGVDTIGYWPWLMHVYHPAEEQRLFFDRLREWGKQFCFEVPVVKGHDWCGTLEPLNGTTAFRFYLELEKEFKKNGLAKVDCFAFDEPVYAALAVIPHQIAQGTLTIDGYRLSDDHKVRMDYGLRETAKYMKHMRERYPDAKYMDIEPYPAMSLEALKYSVDGLIRECAALKTPGPDALRIDVDWAAMEAGLLEGSWKEVKELAEYVRSKGMEFSLIYWAADKPRLDDRGIDKPLQWYAGVLHMLGVTKTAGLEPDEYVMESWIHMPGRFGPETDNTAYTGCLRDWLELIKK
ncbi:MAG: hypothetical protein IK083_05320 [Abditibacteriota bacterium]|nr:hypothetical protein [Abditibacteriota bacterium]